MQTIREMSPAQLAPLIGNWCDDATARAMQRRLLAAEYERPVEVPDAIWDAMLAASVAEVERGA